MQNKQYTMMDVCGILECDPASLPPIRSGMGYAEAVQTLEELKRILKAAYKKAITRHHPDHGGDPEKAKEINAVWGEVKKMKIIQRPQPVVRMRMRWRTCAYPYSNPSAYYYYNCDSTTI